MFSFENIVYCNEINHKLMIKTEVLEGCLGCGSHTSILTSYLESRGFLPLVRNFHQILSSRCRYVIKNRHIAQPRHGKPKFIRKSLSPNDIAK